MENRNYRFLLPVKFINVIYQFYQLELLNEMLTKVTIIYQFQLISVFIL